MMRVYVRVDGFCKAAALYCEYVTEGTESMLLLLSNKADQRFLWPIKHASTLDHCSHHTRGTRGSGRWALGVSET